MFGISSLELSKKDDDFRDVEMFPVNIEEEEEVVPPDEFVREIYELARKRAHRTDGIYPSDLLYDMIPHVLTDGTIVWWMNDSHPIALMLLENDITSNGAYEELASMKSHLGHIIIYSDDMVKECRDCIIDFCHQFKLNVLEEPQEIVIENNSIKDGM